jgi:hypothetical protein
MSKILLYQEATTGVTTNGEQHAFFINENGVPTVKNGSQVITFSTSGSAFTGSSGSSGANGSAGVNGTAGSSGESGATGASGSSGSSGATGSSGSSGANGLDGAVGADGAVGSSGTSGQTYGTSGSSGATGSSGSSGAPGAAGTSGTSGQEGLGNYVATTTANITRSSNNAFTKSSGGDSWNAGFYSAQQGFRSAYIAGSPSSTTGLALLGMSSGTIVTNDPAFIDYGIGVYSGSTNIVVIESGTVKYTHSSAPTSSTRYLINYDLENVRYYIDGLLVHTTARVELGLLYLDCAIYTQDAGFTGVVFGSTGTVGPAGSTGAAGTSGSSGANGSSGTSAAGGGGAATYLNVQVHYTGQTKYDYYGTLLDQWKTTYYNSERIDRGTGDGYITKVWGYIVPFTLKPGEKIKKLGGFINSKITGTAYCKVGIYNNHPHQNSPYAKQYESELTVTCPGYSDLVWSTWDYDYQHTGTTEEQFWFIMLYPQRANNDFEWSQGYRETYEMSHVTSVYPTIKTNQWMIFDDTAGTYTTMPSNFSYFLENNTWPVMKLSFANDRTLPIVWQTELNS